MDELLDSIRILERRKEELLREVADVDLALDVQKAQYARLLNDQAPIYKLPNELLITIFITCQQSLRHSSKATTTPFQVVISHITHRWRQVVLSTPLLWNTINFRVRPMNHVQRHILSQLQAHLTRSDTCFLDITLDFHIVDNISAYLSLLSPESARWRRLAIITRYEQIDEIRALLRDAHAPLLEHLSLSLGKPQDGTGSLSPRKQYACVLPTITPSASSLRFVRLAGLALGSLHPPTSSITTLHLDGWTRHYMTYDQFKSILTAATSLVNLSLNQLCIHHPRDPFEILQPVELAHLRNLRIRGTCRPLSLMRMPNLHSISLQNVDTFDSDAIPSVQSLHLDSCALDRIEIDHLIRSFPAIRTLSIDESLPDIYDKLIPETVLGTSPANTPWPHLQTIMQHDLLNTDVPQFCHMLFDMSRTRKELTKVCLDRRSRTVLRAKLRLDWLQNLLQVENCDVEEPWPLGLGYEDAHDLLQ
ncbi:hypothetical protein JR316_0006010 [Psilocybe cubensis]|uniref:F-box domain-containing protein n=2 Tax=Psilocybe cubensis TaxID=181762 RepID=A0A8H7Y324_PSICU|nr:hypothetical protein JR316_0006010 [Psilocybe cubensis]KAH9481483.1 hypothetical protein JR316_0006010 [Psilocybe cubensis]